MLCISMLDLMPAATEEVGFAAANTWFFAGVAFFAVVVHFIPEPSSEGLVLDEAEPAAPAIASSKKQDGDGDGAAGKAAAGKADKGTAGRRPTKRCAWVFG